MKNATYINAGAGSGKTYSLTLRLSEKMNGQNPVKPDQIILTTFTELAAAEFKTKARQMLIERNNVIAAAALDGAAIGTVHSIALLFIKKYWYLLNISPKIDVITDENKRILQHRLLSQIVSEEDKDIIDAYNKQFNISPKDNNFWIDDVDEVMLKIYYYNINDMTLSINESCKYINSIFPAENHISQEDINLIIRFCQCYREFCSTNTTGNGVEGYSILKYFNPEEIEYHLIQKLCKILEDLGDFAGSKRGSKTFEANYNINLESVLSAMRRFLESDKINNILSSYAKIVFKIAQETVRKYTEAKKANNVIDYNDMESNFLQLLDNPTVQDEIHSQYRLLMVDEFQDSNPMQIAIFEKLSNLVEETVIVGDPKQAIYGFRGCDTELVEKTTRQFYDAYLQNQNALKHDSLNKTWRSRKDLVELANDVFVRAMPNLDKSQIVLKPNTENIKEIGLGHPIYHMHFNTSKTQMATLLAQRIAKMFKNSEFMILPKGATEIRAANYKDLAILARTNSDCEAFINALRKEHVPVATQEVDIIQRAETQLILNLLQYILLPHHKCTIANLARLLNDVTTENAILGLINDSESDLLGEWVSKLESLRNNVLKQPLTALVESIILELDLYAFVDKWGDSTIRHQNLNTIRNVANEYDAYCLQLGIGASVSGFIDYLNTTEIEPSLDNISNTVKVLTYHKSKGLEWPIVILASLGNDPLDKMDVIKKSICGVNLLHNNNEENYINFFPNLVQPGNNTNILSNIVDKIMATTLYDDEVKKIANEETRLMYVGFTRARNYLITTSNYISSKKPFPNLKWLQNMNVIGEMDANFSSCDNIWGSKYNVKTIYEIYTKDDIIEQDEVEENYNARTLRKNENEISNIKKNISPSSLSLPLNVIPEVSIIHSTNSRISLQNTSGIMADIGTCIHNIFAVYDNKLPIQENVTMAAKIINNNRLSGVITNPDEVILSIDKFYEFLSAQYGPATSIKHETPFYFNCEGQIIHGEIDMLWTTANGTVLIDFKNFPGSSEAIINKDNDHYAGLYGPQLFAYNKTLKANKINVLDVLIYYSVIGDVVRFNIK